MSTLVLLLMTLLVVALVAQLARTIHADGYGSRRPLPRSHPDDTFDPARFA